MPIPFSELWGERLDAELSTQDRLQLFTVAARKRAVNDAMDKFVELTQCTKRYGSVAITSTVQEYNVETITDFIRLLGDVSIKIVRAGVPDRYLQGPYDLPRRDYDQLRVEYPSWRSAGASTPSRWYYKEEDGGTWVGFYPAPLVGAGETWSIEVPYLAEPARLVGDDDIPFTVAALPLKRLYQFHDGLVHYAAAKLEPLRKNYTGVDRQMRLFGGSVSAYMAQRTENQDPHITLERDYYNDRNTRALDPRRYP